MVKRLYSYEDCIHCVADVWIVADCINCVADVWILADCIRCVTDVWILADCIRCVADVWILADCIHCVADVWILAAKHELEFRQSMHGARALLQQAIATNPDSQQLWLEVRSY